MVSKETSLVLGFTVKISSSFLHSRFPEKKKSSSQIGAVWFLEKMYHGISVNFPSHGDKIPEKMGLKGKKR